MKQFVACCVAMGVMMCPAGLAVGAVMDFEGYALGTINGQFGWSVEDSFGDSSFVVDQEIVDLGGNKAWRLSNAVSSTGYSDQPFSPTTTDVAGETGSYLYNDFGTIPPPNNPVLPGEGAATKTFTASLDFKSVTEVPEADLSVALSPSAKQSPVRFSFVRIDDNGSDGFDLVFFDTNDDDSFFGTTIATSLSYTEWHNITMEIEFVDGVDTSGGTADGNDIVKISVDGSLVHTGTSWESFYYATGGGNGITAPRLQAVDSMLFRVSSAAPGAAGDGLYFDNVLVEAQAEAGVPEPSSLTIWSIAGLLAWCRRRRKRLAR